MDGQTCFSGAATAGRLARTAWAALGGEAGAPDRLGFTGSGGLPSAFPVTDLAAAAIGTAGLAMAELAAPRGDPLPAVTVDRRLASLWFGIAIRPVGWSLPTPWDPIAGDYPARDGWIRLHTNAPHHRAAAERVLGPQTDRAGVARAVAGWTKGELEAAIVAAGGCAAEMRSAAQWADHPQGRAVAAEPLAQLTPTDPGPVPAWPVPAARPLQGIKVLDLTRVLAGPVATRFLAGFGAEVLRIDPPGWDEPAIIPDVTRGKRCARLDLRQAGDRRIFESLLAGADILLHGYRPGALDRLGFDPATRQRLSPGLVDVCLDAYGWSGPWAQRRGFDSLVQMSCGIAARGQDWKAADRPVPLPVQGLDHATGYLLAAAAIRGLTLRLRHGQGLAARLSLARTAGLLADAPADPALPALAVETDDDQAPAIEATPWGPARWLKAPVTVAGSAMAWALPSGALGSAMPGW